MYTVVKTDHDDGSDCTLVVRYSLDIVPVSEVELPRFIGTYGECQFLVDQIEQEEIAFHCQDLDYQLPENHSDYG